MMRYIGFILLIVTGAASASAEDTATDALLALFKDERRYHIDHTPGATEKDAPRQGPANLPEITPAYQQRKQVAYQSFLARLDAIDRSDLTPDHQLNYDLFRYYVNRHLVFLRHRSWRQPLYSDSGFHTNIVRLWSGYPMKTVEDGRRYIAWLQDIPRYFEDQIANLRLGLKEGFTMPAIVLDGLLPSFRATVKGPVGSLYFARQIQRLKGLPEAEFTDLHKEALSVISHDVVPAYKALADFMEGEYRAGAAQNISISAQPGGDAYYADMVKFYTTLDITAQEVHALGLKEVARIRAEMEKVKEETGFTGTFQDFITFLREDAQFYAKTPDELIMRASFLAKQIDAQMPRFFKTLPRQPYGVEPVPEAIAPNYTTGRYVGAPIGSEKGGTYWVNTSLLNKRPLYNLPSLTLHEAVPGHHHQSAISKELKNVPEFRLGLYPHAFGEGWGLYSEKLGMEMGIYKTPYDHFGRLSYEMWRAARLVVDTGMHAMGWSRQQAMTLMEENSALSKHNIRTEVDRYISWPGQALAYKMGELTFLRLRLEATEALGPRFDIRAFHDVILAEGGMPLTLVEQRVKDFISQSKAP